jgi:predicted phage-related endonuclease
MIQGSAEWLQARCGVITASNFSKVFTTTGKLSTSRDGLINQLIAENLTGKPTEMFKSEAMQRGNDLESTARMIAELKLGVSIEEVGLIKMADYEIGCSSDGLFGDTGIEIKCPLPATHCAYLRANKLPSTYVQQVQGTMLVLNMQHYFFISYHPDMKPLIIEVQRDDELLALAEPLLIETAEIIKSETLRLRKEND